MACDDCEAMRKQTQADAAQWLMRFLEIEAERDQARTEAARLRREVCALRARLDRLDRR